MSNKISPLQELSLKDCVKLSHDNVHPHIGLLINNIFDIYEKINEIIEYINKNESIPTFEEKKSRRLPPPPPPPDDDDDDWGPFC